MRRTEGRRRVLGRDPESETFTETPGPWRDVGTGGAGTPRRTTSHRGPVGDRRRTCPSRQETLKSRSSRGRPARRDAIRVRCVGTPWPPGISGGVVPEGAESGVGLGPVSAQAESAVCAPHSRASKHGAGIRAHCPARVGCGSGASTLARVRGTCVRGGASLLVRRPGLRDVRPIAEEAVEEVVALHGAGARLSRLEGRVPLTPPVRPARRGAAHALGTRRRSCHCRRRGSRA